VSRRSRRIRIADGHLDFPRGKEIAFDDVGIDGDGFPSDHRGSADMADAPKLTDGMTRGQKARFCRNLAILAGHRLARLSHRQLAGIFDLPRSRIAAILAEMEARLPCSS
jgi:hypothetical protein